MSKAKLRYLVLALLGGCALALVPNSSPAQSKADDDEDKSYGYEFSADPLAGSLAPGPTLLAPRARLAPAAPAGQTYGATPGGAQDIAFARAQILAGKVPHPSTFTPEGLFSRYDLPLAGSACGQTLCLESAAVRADLVAQTEVRYIAQLGFSSSIDPKTWQREPVTLIAVVDRSGSMNGTPLETVKESLHQVVDQLTVGDRLGIVEFGSLAAVHLPVTAVAAGKQAIRASIDALRSDGATDLESGLALGFDQAQKSAQAGFKGRTRVMLFTDERPNVGATDPGSFMWMCRTASRKGIGLTTIGVATQFGAELATQIASVRGGNLFFFPDVAAMAKRFRDDFDTMITELGFDLQLTIEPRAGYRLVGLYGVPGDAVQRTPTGGLSLTVETLFLSKERGGIFLGFAPDSSTLPASPGPLGDATLSYEDLQGRKHSDQIDFPLLTTSSGGQPKLASLPLGLARGVLLIDEVTTLKKATALHLEKNDQEKAYQLVRSLRSRFDQSGVTGLDPERRLIAKLHDTLQHLSGHRGETGDSPAGRHPVSGLPR